MARRSRKIAFAVLALLLLMQFYQPRQNARVTSQEPNSIETVANVPHDVKAILQRSCYDCHSNATDYPWYSYIQPVGWWLEGHITEGKEELNFSDFGAYSQRWQASKLESIAGEVRSGAMPPESYRSLHKDAQLSKSDTRALLQWVVTLQDSLQKQ